MSQLSVQAMRESLKGGMPVADVVQANPNNPRSRVVMSSSGAMVMAGPGGPQQSNEQAAVQVMKVIKTWDKGTYDVKETLDLLQSFVFPPTLKNEIYLYGVNTKLAEGKSESLGRMLMEWAAAAGKTDDVLKQAEERAKGPDTKLSYLALKTFNALGSKNLAEAKANLEQIDQALAVSNTEVSTNTALHAALPAIDEPDLRTEAYKIVEKGILFRLKTAFDEQQFFGSSQRRANEHVSEVLDGQCRSRQDQRVFSRVDCWLVSNMQPDTQVITGYIFRK